MEGQEERVEVIWNGCVVHVAAMPASLCGGILVSCWKTVSNPNFSTILLLAVVMSRVLRGFF